MIQGVGVASIVLSPLNILVLTDVDVDCVLHSVIQTQKVFQEIKIIPWKASVVRPLLKCLPVKHFKIFLKYFTMKYFLNMKMSRDNYDSHLTSFI